MCRLFVYIYTFSSPLLSLSEYMQLAELAQLDSYSEALLMYALRL